MTRREAASQTVWVLGDNGQPAAVAVTGDKLSEGQEVIVGPTQGQEGSAASPFGRGGMRF
jgi:hypothetical protein